MPKLCFVLFKVFLHPRQSHFKRWLAQVGYERLEEIENPELVTKRTRELYKWKM
jgi:DNA-damage-inducible protein D